MLFKGISHFLYVAIVNFNCLELPVGLDLKYMVDFMCLRHVQN